MSCQKSLTSRTCYREASLDVRFDEANGSVDFHMYSWPEADGPQFDWPGASILDYLDVLVPRSCTP